jgi:imidazolonepropionase-like amidohydrolase
MRMIVRPIILAVALVGLPADRCVAQTIVIQGATIIDATGAAPRARQSIRIEDGRIVAIRPAGDSAMPSDAIVVNALGKFLIPGLWDMHVHLTKAGAHTLPLFVANGVTGVRDAGGDFETIARMRREIAAGTRVGPRIKAAGPILESARNYERQLRSGTVEQVARYRAPVADSAAAARVVDSLRILGVDFIKARSVPSTEAYHALADAARRAGLPLAAHGDVAAVDEMLRAGQRSIEHAILPPLRWKNDVDRRRLIRQLVAGNVALVPTIVNFYEFFMVPRNRALAIINDSLGTLDPRRRYVCCYLLEDWREQLEDLGGSISLRRPVLSWVYGSVIRDLRDLHRAGVTIMPGTDVAVAMMYPGFSLHDELQYFVEDIGMSPLQALMSATRAPAEWFGMRDSLGTIEEGKVADLVLLDADPLADIRNTRRIAGVILTGRYFDRAALDAMLEIVAAEASGKRR